MTKNATPNTAVNLVINNSPPRSFRFLNKESFPPVKAAEALSAFELCNNTIAINKIDTINNNIVTNRPPLTIYNLAHIPIKSKY